MANEINISAQAPLPIKVTLVGEEYEVRPIKGAIGIQMAQRFGKNTENPAELVKSIDALIGMIFGKSAKKTILARLNDAEDLLDFTHIIELVQALMENQSGNPSTS